MNVKVMYIPKSERGREVYRLLKPNYSLKYEDVLGRYVGNLDVNLDYETLRKIAYILDPERAAWAEDEAYNLANDIRDNPARHGIDPNNDARIEAEAELAEQWAQ